MNILQLHWGFLLGGGNRYVQSLEKLSLVHEIYSHGLCIIDPRWSIDEDGLSRIAHTRILIQSRLDRSWIAAVAEQIRCRKPDLLMTHGFNAHFVALIAQRHLKHIVPVVSSYHGPYHAINPQKQVLGIFYERFTEYFFRHHAMAVVTVAEHARQHLIRRGIPLEKITLIHNAIGDILPELKSNILRDKWRRHWGIREGDVLIGAVGRLDPIKGFTYLIEAFNSIALSNPSAKLILIGDGPDRARLESLVKKSPAVDRILLVGGIPDAAGTLAAFDIYVLPSLSECHSIALLEAMRAGLPIVATAVGGNPESITHEQEGLLVPTEDSMELVSALKRMAHDGGFRHHLGSNARQRYLKDFTLETMLRKTAGWLNKCAAAAKNRIESPGNF